MEPGSESLYRIKVISIIIMTDKKILKLHFTQLKHEKKELKRNAFLIRISSVQKKSR